MFPFDTYTFDVSPEGKELLTATFEIAPNKFINGWSQRLIQAPVKRRRH